MKTKNLVLLVLAIFVGSLTLAQTNQQKKGAERIDSKTQELVELKILFQDIEDLNHRLSPPIGQYGPQELEKKALESRLNALKKRLTERQRAFAVDYNSVEDLQKDLAILLRQKKQLEESVINEVIQQKTPKELKNIQKRRRENSLEVRSEEVKLSKEQLSLEKLKQTPVDANGVMGYKVLVWNQDKRKSGNFKLRDMSGKDLDKGAFYLGPGEKIEVYLLPGLYQGTVEISGRLPSSTTVEVSITQKFVNGIAYHGYLIQPPR
jgi:hypothetical protein